MTMKITTHWKTAYISSLGVDGRVMVRGAPKLGCASPRVYVTAFPVVTSFTLLMTRSLVSKICVREKRVKGMGQ